MVAGLTIIDLRANLLAHGIHRRKMCPSLPTFCGSPATIELVQNSDALRVRELWESKVASRPGKPEIEVAPAFNELIQAYEPEVSRFVSRKVAPEAIDDVLQEIWVAAWQGFSDLQDRSKLRPWIYGICLHKCHDHYRARIKSVRFVAISDVEILDPGPSPETLATDAARIGILLKNLDESQREIIELYYYAQLTLAEISTVLGRNMNTVKYQFYRAHDALLATGRREELL